MGGERRRRRSLRRGSNRGADVEERLRGELRRLQHRYGLSPGLEGVRWLPGEGGYLSGEVRGNTIYIYEADPVKAIQTLRHEVLDNHLTREALEPLVNLINLQKSAIGEDNIQEERRTNRKALQASLDLWVGTLKCLSEPYLIIIRLRFPD